MGETVRICSGGIGVHSDRRGIHPLLWAAIFCAVGLVYFPALNGGFLWDDDGHVCPEGLRSIGGLWRIWTDLGATQQYYPMLHSAFWLEYQLWGEASVGYHGVNLLLHATSACLVTAVVRRLALPGAWLAGLIFALHPVCVESVAWISEQKNTLSAAFYLGSAYAYLCFAHDRRISGYRLALGLFILALLTKTVTATLPVVLLIVAWWQHGRLRWKQDVRPLVSWLVLGACGGLFTAWVEQWVIGAQGSDYALTVVQRGLLASRAVWFYLGKLAWPAELNFIYPRWTIDPTAWREYLFPFALLLTGGVLGVRGRKNRGLKAGFMVYLTTLFPVLGFLDIYPFAFTYVADHFQYLASLGVIVPVAAGLVLATNRISPKGGGWAPPILAVLLLAILGGLTWRQARLYRSAQALYEATLTRNPDCWLAHNNLAKILATLPGREADAIGHFEAALKVNPRQADTHFNLANSLARTSRTRREAIGHYEAALAIMPDFADAHNNLGTLLAADPSQLAEAITHFRAALRLAPTLVAAHSNLGTAWARIPGHLADAIVHYEAALQLNPRGASLYFDLANALAKTPDRKPEAIAAYEAALKINPAYAEAHSNLATLLWPMPQRRPEAIGHYKQALRLRPDWDFIHQILDHAGVN